MARELVPGIWRLEGIRGCNVYLVAVRGALVLIDSGLPGSTPRVIREVDALGVGSPDFVLLTHGHADHAGGAEAIRRRFGSRVAIGAGDCEVVAGVPRVRAIRPRSGAPWPLAWLARRVGVSHSGAAVPSAEVDLQLSGETHITPGLIAVPTPGHTTGSYCFIEADRGIAFVGDLVLSFPDGLARPLAVISDDDRAYVSSLRAFAARAPAAGLAGHGRAVLHGFDDAVRGLAEQPRRVALTPGRLLRRFRRLAWFAYHYLNAGG